uniref:Protein PHYLLOic isoform X2 n=1 Tax=Rhizophora mucronata TaxID=61149 RepID=A0A2P2MWH8_RHIMU
MPVSSVTAGCRVLVMHISTTTSQSSSSNSATSTTGPSNLTAPTATLRDAGKRRNEAFLLRNKRARGVTEWLILARS